MQVFFNSKTNRENIFSKTKFTFQLKRCEFIPRLESAKINFAELRRISFNNKNKLIKVKLEKVFTYRLLHA
jgi:hypothetical protein